VKPSLFISNEIWVAKFQDFITAGEQHFYGHKTHNHKYFGSRHIFFVLRTNDTK